MCDSHADKLDAVRMLLNRIKAEPFPNMGKAMGDFVLYDALLAGTATSAVAHRPVAVDDIPIPDAETVEIVNGLRTRTSLSISENEFVAYFDLLIELRDAVAALCADKSAIEGDVERLLF